MSSRFLVAWRRLDEVPQGDAARLWLYGTARRVLANQHRGQRRRQRLFQRLGAESRSRPVVGPPDAGLTGAAAAFERLGPSDREILSLLAWESLSVAEIAEALGCSRNAARIRIHRARRRFERELSFDNPVKHNPVEGQVSEAYD